MSLTNHKDAVQDFYSKHFDTILKELDHEISLLKEWFTRDFPEATLRVFVDVDNIKRSFTLTTEVLSGREMAANLRALKNRVVFEEKDIIKPGFMKAFISHMQYPYRQEITRALNSHYHQERERGS